MVKKETKEVYDRIADSWNNKVWAKSEEFNFRIVSFASVNGNEKSLDVGIGSGDLESFLKLDAVMGVDISKSMLDVCKIQHPNFSLCLSDAEYLPFENERFDFVFSRNLLQNFIDPKKAFGELYRVLKNGGKLMVIEGAVYENERIYPTQTVRVVEPHHPLFPSHEQLRNLFDDYGLNSVEQRVEALHKKWLSGFCKSKQVSHENRMKLIRMYEELPDWYKSKYIVTVHKSEDEIESSLTFSFIKGIK